MPTIFPTQTNGAHDVTASGGMSSTSHPLATAAATEMLLAGGNAVDAAIAAAFALALCEPAMSHLGGQGNMLVHLAEERRTVALDFYACAPGAAAPDMYDWIESPTQGGYRFWTEGDHNTIGGRSVAIPGNVCGWLTAHQRWGSLPLADVVAPARRLAERGVPLTRRMAAMVAEVRDRLAKFPETARTFLNPDGSPLREGEVVRQPDLAGTLDVLARDGLDAFYTGPLAHAIVSEVGRLEGVLSLDDLRAYPDRLFITREPDRASFRGYEVQGATLASSALLLHLLTLLDECDFRGHEPLGPDKVHLLVEVMKLAYAEREVHIADANQVNVPLEGLLSRAYARSRLAHISPDEARFPGPGAPWGFQDRQPDPAKQLGSADANGRASAGGGTTHHSHVDAAGNFVSITHSLGDPFGSCVTVPGTGILLNDAMKLFDPRPDAGIHGIAPYRRPIAPWPTLLLRDGRAVLALGSPSGTRIPNALAQVLLNLTDHGMSLQAAVNQPRVHWSGHELEAEGDLPAATLDGLRRRGHEVELRSARSPWFGAVQAVARHPKTGVCQGAADPRRQGAVAGVAAM